MITMIAMGVVFTGACIYFFFAGFSAGAKMGAQGITQYYLKKRALKDKSNIIGYASWTDSFKKIFEEAEEAVNGTDQGDTK